MRHESIHNEEMLGLDGTGAARDRSALAAFTISVIGDERGMESLRDEWERLEAIADVDVFQTYVWLSSWWQSFGRHPQRSLHIVTIHDGRALQAACPFFIEEDRWLGRTLGRRLRLMGCGVAGGNYPALLSALGPSDYLNILLHPQAGEATFALLTQHCGELLAEGIEIDFEHVPARSPLLSRLARSLEDGQTAVRRIPSDTCPRMTLPADMQSMVKSLRPEIRRRVSQASRATGEMYEVHAARTGAEVAEALDQLVRLHQQRWNQLGFPGLFADRRFAELQRTSLTALFSQGRVWCGYATMDKQCIAVRIGLRLNGTMYDYLSGFDAQSPAAKRRPGIALLLAMMEEGMQRGVTTLDFLRGDEEYKFDFADQRPTNTHLVISRGRPASGTMRAVNAGMLRLQRAGRAFAKERALFAVQRSVHGVIAGVAGYVRFRTERLRTKARNSAGVAASKEGTAGS